MRKNFLQAVVLSTILVFTLSCSTSPENGGEESSSGDNPSSAVVSSVTSSVVSSGISSSATNTVSSSSTVSVSSESSVSSVSSVSSASSVSSSETSSVSSSSSSQVSSGSSSSENPGNLNVQVSGNTYNLPLGFFYTDDITGTNCYIAPTTNGSLNLSLNVPAGSYVSVYYYIDGNNNGQYDYISETARESYNLLNIVSGDSSNVTVTLTPKVITGTIEGDLGSYRLYMNTIGGLFTAGMVYHKGLIPVFSYQLEYYVCGDVDEDSTAKLYLYKDLNANKYHDAGETLWTPSGTDWFMEVNMGHNSAAVTNNAGNTVFTGL